MTNPRLLLDHYGLTPKKSLGQNFLHDPNTLAKIVEVAGLEAEDTVLEIGAGTGALTRLLAERTAQVVAVEVDERLQTLLRHELGGYDNVRLHWGDILDADLGRLMGEKPYKVVANLPYYITSAILRKLLESQPKPLTLTVMVQKQVAERLVAKPDEMSLLAVSVQFYGVPKIVHTLKPSVFYPRPDVDSAVIHLGVSPQPQVAVPSEKLFFEVVRAGFGQKRKQLKNALTAGLSLHADQAARLLQEANIDPQRRAETLTLAEWGELTRLYAAQFRVNR
jgi:16S rRNA (adenine1518-N6/adenine1519-N6)-dimethyltransferase